MPISLETECHILKMAYDVLLDMERDGTTSIMTTDGPISPSAARQMVAARYDDLSRRTLQ